MQLAGVREAAGTQLNAASALTEDGSVIADLARSISEVTDAIDNESNSNPDIERNAGSRQKTWAQDHAPTVPGSTDTPTESS